MEKPKLGVFSFSCCSGCQIAVLNQEDILVELMQKFQILNFHLIQKKSEDGPFDIAVVEGSITHTEQIDMLRSIREKSALLIAMGACATEGGIHSIKNFRESIPLTKEEAKNPRYRSFIRSDPLDKYVKVDLQLRGCPITKEEFAYTMKQLLLGKMPEQWDYPVCSECRERENECFLNRSILCMGPVTLGGCRAVCTSNGVACEGCRGPTGDANYHAHVSLLKEMGLKEDELRRHFVKYSGNRIADKVEKAEKKENGSKK